MHRIATEAQLAELDFQPAARYECPMRALSLAFSVALTACVGATETNVTPAPCERDDECGPDQRCAPLDEHDASANDSDVPTFCRER
jgi:hypothetical protein